MLPRKVALAVLVSTLLTATQLPDALPPVLADTFGNTSTSGMSLVGYTSGIVFFARFAAPSSGTLSSISFFASGSSGPGNVAIYSSSGALFAQGTPKTITDGVNTFSSLSASVSITSGTYYWLGLVMTDGSFYMGFSGGEGRNSMLSSSGCCAMPISLTNMNPVSGSIGIFATYSTAPPPPPFVYTLSSSSSFGVTVGNSGSTTITATLTSGTAQGVMLSCSGLPMGATCTFNPTSMTPTTSGASSTLTIATMSSTPTGSYTITVTGSPSPTSPTSFTLTVSAGPDFTPSASPTSQNLAAGATASFTISISAVGGYTETISLSVTSGCPTSSTCSISGSPIASPYSSTATLTVQTGSTTASGTYTVVVTAAGTTKTHTVSMAVAVAGPTAYNFNVKSGATQIVITVSWTGSGSASVIVQGPAGTPTIAESGGVVFDRTSIAVVSGSPTYSSIHRVTFTITATTSAQAWTLLLAISGPTSYNITIEVS